MPRSASTSPASAGRPKASSLHSRTAAWSAGVSGWMGITPSPASASGSR